MTDQITRMLNSAQQPMPARPSTSGVRVGVSTALLLVCVPLVLLITMSPTPIDHGYEGAIRELLRVLHSNGVPDWFEYSMLEFTANIMMFVPVGLMIGLLLPWRGIWLGVLMVPAFSGAIELTQAAVLSQRSATVQDVAANSIGGWVGLLAAVFIVGITHARDRRVIEREDWDRHWGRR